MASTAPRGSGVMDVTGLLMFDRWITIKAGTLKYSRGYWFGIEADTFTAYSADYNGNPFFINGRVDDVQALRREVPEPQD